MRFIKVLILCCILSFTLQAQNTYKVGVIGFYNLENLFDTIDQPDVNDDEFTPGGANLYTPEVYKDKLGKLSDVIADIGLDASPDGLSILGVAEIENESVLKDLASMPKLKSRNYQIVHYDSPDRRGIDVAMFYNPKYFTVRHSEPLYVPLKNSDGSLYYTRDILYVYGSYCGEPIHIFVNHWPSRRGGEEASAPSRAIAARVAKACIDSINTSDPTAKIILMGDLNDDPVSPSMTKVLGTQGNREKVKPKGIYNPWVSYYKEGIGTLAYNDAWNLFDQIVISYPFLDKKQNGFFFQKASIYKKEFMLQKTGRYKGYPLRTYDYSIYMGGYSDHFPTYITLLRPVNK